MSSINGITIGSSAKRLACVVLFGGVACSIPERTLAPADTGGSGGSSNSGGSGTGATSGSSGTSGSAGNTGGMGNAGGAGNSGSGGSAAIGGMGGSSANGGISGAANAGTGGSAGCANPVTAKFRLANTVHPSVSGGPQIVACLGGQGNFHEEPAVLPKGVSFGQMTDGFSFPDVCADVSVKLVASDDCSAEPLAETTVPISDVTEWTFVYFHNGIEGTIGTLKTYPIDDQTNRFRVINAVMGPDSVDWQFYLVSMWTVVFSDVYFGQVALGSSPLGPSTDEAGYVDNVFGYTSAQVGVAEVQAASPFVNAEVNLNIGESLSVFAVGHYGDFTNPPKLMVCSEFVVDSGYAQCQLMGTLGP